MPNEEHFRILQQGVETWNRWRKDYPTIRPDLSRAYLQYRHLSGIDLSKSDLSSVDFGWAHLGGANLHAANLSKATLIETTLSMATLTKAILTEADLSSTNFSSAVLTGADLTEAHLAYTVFGDTTLSDIKGLDTCYHYGPSIIDFQTLAKSRNLPLPFLRGCGLPDAFIDYLPSLLNEPIQFYSCFISYSHQDEAFVQRLHADLQNKGVRCWYAAEDMKIGDRIRDTIDQQIRLRDKLLVVLSTTSIESEWVEDEVEAALEEERKGQERRTVLFPIKIDNTVEDTDRAWVHKITRTRHIGDFTHWKDHDAYQKAFDRLLSDLQAEGRIDSPKL